jgi:hypothetical protein
MSGGLAVKTKKRGVVRAGAERLPGPRFLPEGLGLDGLGAAGPRLGKKKISRRLRRVVVLKTG